MFGLPCAVGDRYKNLSGDIVEIVSISFDGVFATCHGVRSEFVWSEVSTLIASGAWRRIGTAATAPAGKPGQCTKCGTRNEYQSVSFTCWACKVGA